MGDFFKHVWQEQRVIGLLTGGALCLSLVFAAEFALEAAHFAQPANRDRPIEAWMSIRYVEQSWGLTKPVMFDLIGYDVETPPREVPKTVGAFLAESGLSLTEFQTRIEDAQALMQDRRGHRDQ